MLSQDEVKRLFELAKIKATPEELEKFPGELEAILNYIKKLSEAELRDVSPIFSLASGETKLRADKEVAVRESDYLKKQFPETENGYLKTKEVFGE